METYSDMRKSLDELPRMRSRRSSSETRFQRAISEDEVETFGAPVSMKELTKREATDFRASMVARFGLPPKFAGYISDEANYLDQGDYASCSFMGLLHLLNISGEIGELDTIIPARDRANSWAFWQRSWTRVWVDILRKAETNVNVADAASTLDVVLSGKQHFAPAGFTYLPVRSAGNSEMSFNKTFWVEPELVCAKIGIEQGGYRDMPWTYQTAFFMEDLISKGIPVGFNSDCHTRVAVGFDETHILCLDSFGVRHQEGNKDRIWKAGLSLSEKWLVYNYVREIMFFAPQTILYLPEGSTN